MQPDLPTEIETVSTARSCRQILLPDPPKELSVGPIALDIYCYVINLLGKDNAVNVFPRTGDPVNDGWFLTTGGQADAAFYGPQYVAFYHAVNDGKNSGNWGPPRQIRFGVRLEY